LDAADLIVGVPAAKMAFVFFVWFRVFRGCLFPIGVTRPVRAQRNGPAADFACPPSGRLPTRNDPG